MKLFLINFLAKSGNSKHFSFYSFFQKKNPNCGHFVCPAPSKKVVAMFTCHLPKSINQYVLIPSWPRAIYQFTPNAEACL